jgi:hypothetical protein
MREGEGAAFLFPVNMNLQITRQQCLKPKNKNHWLNEASFAQLMLEGDDDVFWFLVNMNLQIARQ